VKSKILIQACVIVVAGFVCAGAASAREQIRVVGSSTVYPFTTAVAEQFGKRGGFKTPVVESTGTGGGIKLFCAGVGADNPDAVNASRRMKTSEFESCQKNGVKNIVEIRIGFDGLTIAHAKQGPDLKLTRAQVFKALAKQVPDASGKLVPNPYTNWNQIDPALPASKIEVLGPPPTSGTRDSFHELFMEAGALEIPALAELKKTDAKAFESAWKSLREDGVYVEAGENDNLIVQKLGSNPNAYGIFGFSFLEENAASIKGVEIEGVAPLFETISDGSYSAARELYVYVKKEHIGAIPGLQEFAAEYVSDDATGEEGYLADKGLVPLPKAEHDKSVAEVKSLIPLTLQDLSK
jgi:phosphate transport system substrate-binding protein